MNKIPTAAGFLIQNNDQDFRLSMSGLNVSDMMVQFAKLHVKAALEAAVNKATIMNDHNSYCGNTGSEYPPNQIVDKDSILNAYPENLIV